MYKVILFYFSIFWGPFLIFAQVGIQSNKSSANICDCSPTCASLERELECRHGHITVREDCPCCQICLRQEGESCGDLNSPCDGKLGLTCSSNGICEAISKCKADSDCPSDRFCLKDICADPCPLLQPCLSALTNGHCVTKNHQPRCECPDGMVPNHEVNACLEIQEDSPSPLHVSSPSSVGCKVEGDLKSIGDSFYTQNCEQTCICEEGGVLSCHPVTCLGGLHPIGALKEYTFCREITDAPFADKCCVAAECAGSLLQSVHLPSNEHQFTPFFGKPLLPAIKERKVSEAIAQSMLEHDSPQKFDDLEEIMTGDISHIKDRVKLLKNNHETLMPLIAREKAELAEEAEREGRIDGVIPTERTTLTTFLLQNLNEHQQLPKKTLSSSTSSNETTLPESVSLINNAESSTESTVIFTTPKTETESDLFSEQETDVLAGVTELTATPFMEKEGMITEVASDGQALHNVTMERKGIMKEMTNNEKRPQRVSMEIEGMMMETTNDDKFSLHSGSRKVDGIMIEVASDGNFSNITNGKMGEMMEIANDVKSPNNTNMKMEEMMAETANDEKSSSITTGEMTETTKDEKSHNGTNGKLEAMMAETENEKSSHITNGKLGEMMEVANDEKSSNDASAGMKKMMMETTSGQKSQSSHDGDTEEENEGKVLGKLSTENEGAMTKTENNRIPPHNVSAEVDKETMATEHNGKYLHKVGANGEENGLKIIENDAQNFHNVSTENEDKIMQTDNDEQSRPSTEKELKMESESGGPAFHNTTMDKIVPIITVENDGKSSRNVSTENDGILTELARDGKPLHHVRLSTELTHTETFREGKETNEGNFKPTVTSDKDHKTAMMHHEKFSSKPLMLQVKSSSHNSTTLILPSTFGGVLHYKESRSDIEAMKLTVEEGQGEVTVKGLSPNTRYTFKWAGAGGSGGKGKMEAKTADGCLHNGISYAVGAEWHEGCQTTCSCHSGGVSECHPRCIFVAGVIKDDQCEEKPSSSDPECCVEYNCEKKDNSVLDSTPAVAVQNGNAEEPKLIVTARSHNSITVAWDDFRADNPDRGYVTEYREVPSQNITSEIPWMKKETLRGQPPPTMTIGNLKPNTFYEVRVGIYSQAEERKLIAATETISVPTEPGCVYGNTSFAVGEFFQGCEERCSCAKDGSVKCAGRCTIPYFKKGSFANDPLCSEEQEEGDECCVLVMCAHGGSRTGGEYDQCANTVCGKNAECVSWPTPTEANEEPPQPGSCICKQGFTGDPTDHVVGCTPNATLLENANNCLFRGTSYSTGDVFYDGCSYKCTCNPQGEIECQPRCQYAADQTAEETHGNNSCSYQSDPTDSCCKIKMCNFTSDDVQSPALDFDGCTYGNKTYAKNEAFTFGCDLKCLCMGFSDVSCYPRCPPVKEMSEKEGIRCETLLDPEDECCDVTVCDDSAPDVMKANITAENSLRLQENNTESLTSVEDKNETMISKSATPHESKMTEASVNQTEESNVMSEESNGTVMDKMDSEMKNMSFGEGEVEKMPIITAEKEMIDNSENDTKEMGSTDKTEMFTAFENDMMFKHENGTHEEDAMHIENGTGTLFTTPHSTQSETEAAQLIEEGMGKKMLAIMDDNKNEATTIFPHDIEEKLMHDRAGKVSEANPHLRKKARFESTIFSEIEITEIRPIDSSTVKMTVRTSQDVLSDLLSSESHFLTVSYSPDSLSWTNRTITVDEIGVQNQNELIFLVSDLEANDAFQFKVFYRNISSPTEKASLDSSSHVPSVAVVSHDVVCKFNGEQYAPGENFYDGCAQYCRCTEEDVTVHCEKIQCPEHFGLDLLDPGCIEWEDDPTYRATPPRCCGHIPKCALHFDDLACTHMGQTFQHYDIIPKELVGCDQRCQCFNGSLDCESLCGPVAATPPFHLPCDSHEARLVTAASFPCCRKWQCLNGTISEFDHGLHPDKLPDDFSNIPFTQEPVVLEPELDLLDVKDITETSARIVFTIADIFVGLPGGIYLRYTPKDSDNQNPLTWDSEVIHEDGIIMDRSKWEYVKKDLESGTKYAMQLALFTHLKRAETVSAKFFVTTRTKVTTPLPRLDLDAELSVSEIQNTSAKISWKRFNDLELQYIDGIRVRFWPGNKKFPLEGPMLHREADSMILRDLVPDTKYTVDLFFIPHKGLTSTISNTRNTTFMTLPKPKDIYAFNITIEAGEMTKEGVHILYSGIPEPEGKYVNVYRVVYTTDGDSWDSQKFKVPKNQKEGFITLTDLKPDVQYGVWLEAYLTNGSKKKSNVITIKTKPGELPFPEKSEIGEAGTKDSKVEYSYYSAFVVVVILVALACLIIFGLVFLLFRRQSHAKAHINSSKSTSAYDNPSYKASENQNYAMELNGLKNTTNGASRNEEP